MCPFLHLAEYAGFVAVSWDGGINAGEASRINKLVRKASSVVGLEVDSLESVAVRRMKDKIKSHPRQPLSSSPWWAVADRQLIQQTDHPTQVDNRALQALICHQTVQQQWRPQTITPHNTHWPIFHTSVKVHLILSYLIWWRATSLNNFSPVHQLPHLYATSTYQLMSHNPSKGSMWQTHQSYQAFTGIEFSFIQSYHIMV